MKNGAVFFDRDGVLNVDTGYLYRIEEFRWMPGAIEAIRRVRAAGLLAVVVTNQSGVARGYYTEADVARLHAFMNESLAPHGTALTAFYTCPYHDTGVVPAYVVPDHPDRKPNPGMLLRAMQDLSINPAGSVIIGDKASDIEAGARAGVAGILYQGGDVAAALDGWLHSAQARNPC